VFGSHNSAISRDTLLKLLRREMLNTPRTTTSKKKNKKTKASWNWIERGCLIVADRQIDEIVNCTGYFNIVNQAWTGNWIS
jgi:hypothetical protein